MNPSQGPGIPQVRRKWRPRLGLCVALMLLSVLMLPLMGLFFFRIYENQLIHQTEAELIGQSAVLAARMGRQVEALSIPDELLGSWVAPSPPGLEFDPRRPILPRLDLAGAALGPRRPEAQPPPAPPSPLFLALGAELAPELVETQKSTLAGFRVLDPQGVVIAGREEIGLSLAACEEVKEALQGNFQSVLRLRVSKHEPPPLYSLSRGSRVRIFTAMPVVVRNRVAGVIYASRTPSNVLQHLYIERSKVGLATLCMLVLTLAIGLLFHRTLTGPIRELVVRTRAIAKGDRQAIQPLSRHGTQEIAALTQGFLDMAGSLAARSDFIATFAAHVSHELKSPLTAIKGAAELLRDDLEAGPEAMDDAVKRRFLDNIVTDTQQLAAIVNRLRELAQAETQPTAGCTSLAEVSAALRAGFPGLGFVLHGDTAQLLAISAENLRIVLSHLADNAVRHGADELVLGVQTKGDRAWAAHAPKTPDVQALRATDQSDDVFLTVRDNGVGISPNNRDKIFNNFFTTRRTQGGTGMGLSIVRAMLAAHGGTIELRESAVGAAFVLRIPGGHP